MNQQDEDVKFIIPPGSHHVSIETVDTGLILRFKKENLSDFFCQETDHIEQTPRIGDLALFWDTAYRSSAIIARLKDEEYINGEQAYQAANDAWYENAIRFRSDEQYRLITQRHDVEKEND